MKGEMPNISKDIQYVRVDSLERDPKNARSHTERNIEEIQRSLTQFGQHKPLVVRRDSNIIIIGNGTHEAMEQLEWDSCMVLFVDDDDITAMKRGLADNRTGDPEIGSEWDKDVLRDLLQDMGPDDLEIPGWNTLELEMELGIADLGGYEEQQQQTDEVDKVKTYQIPRALGAYHLRLLSQIDEKRFKEWKNNPKHNSYFEQIVADFEKVLEKRPAHFDCVTVPPMSAKRESMEKYPAAMIAKEVAGRIGVPFIPLFDKRDPGIRHSRGARTEQDQGEFTVGTDQEVHSCLVIDDVSTTGKTIELTVDALAKQGISCFFIAWVFWGH